MSKEARLTKKQIAALTGMEYAEEHGSVTILVTTATEWEGDLFLNHLTAKSLERKGLVVIDWPMYQEDCAQVHLVKEST